MLTNEEVEGFQAGIGVGLLGQSSFSDMKGKRALVFGAMRVCGSKMESGGLGVNQCRLKVKGLSPPALTYRSYSLSIWPDMAEVILASEEVPLGTQIHV